MKNKLITATLLKGWASKKRISINNARADKEIDNFIRS